ncbi:dihydrodipicolinate synthase family protein [Arachnia propionica]|uniref:Dihydrodipicolinate synthase family protein n=1 Tax=Arachnia propionica TaxID=1750 RepID=A0A3P1T672_9ACTN|nr:dihydrodipicolinate synthase family protein [Arachnia propionica]RRD04695.1 dihydrodipicolinate synthase family protein [Arachnia propionica]
MMESAGLDGVVPVLATPFSTGGDLDRASLRRLVEFEVAAGASGLAVFGMASETFVLTDEERIAILQDVVDVAPLPVVAGISATGLAPARVQLTRYAELGARVMMVLPPFLVKPAPGQLVEFFGALGTHAVGLGVEVMVQDAPGASGVTMTPQLIAELAALPGVTSVKVEAPPTVPKMCELTGALAGTRMRLLGGLNAQFLIDELDCGAVATMPGCELTDLLVPIVQAHRAGETTAARRGFERVLPLIVWGLQPGYAWAVHKEVLVHRGIIADATVRAPARRATSRMRELLHQVLTALELRGLPVGAGAT